jgi:hypothetical protein
MRYGIQCRGHRVPTPTPLFLYVAKAGRNRNESVELTQGALFLIHYSEVRDGHLLDADLDLDSDPTLSFIQARKSKKNLTFFIHISASLHCFIFLVSVIIFNILDSNLKFSWKKLSLTFHFNFSFGKTEHRTDPYQQK